MPIKCERHSKRVQQTFGQALGAGVVAILIICTLCGILITWKANPPHLKGYEIKNIIRKIPPKSIDDLKALRELALLVAEQNTWFTFLSWFLLYIFMQICAIPGTLSLSLISGALYGQISGLLAVSVTSTLGSSCCYLLTGSFVGRPLAQYFWPQRLDWFRRQVESRRSNILFYIVFLRVTPVLPNTFINVAAPIVGIDLVPFFVGTFVGCLPNNFLAVSLGSKLRDLNSTSDLANMQSLVFVSCLGLFALLPVWMRSKKQKLT